MLLDFNVAQGYTVADEAYLQRAVAYLTDVLTKQRTGVTRTLNIVYVVCTDDIEWSKQHFPAAVDKHYLIDYVSFTDGGSSPSPTVSFARSTPTIQLALAGFTSFTGFSSSVAALPSDGVTATVATPAVRAQIVYSQGNTDEQDLAILSQCNHTIMTVGTYGWWAGYLAGGITVYYKNFPAEGSSFYRIFSKDDFFPPHWIGL